MAANVQRSGQGTVRGAVRADGATSAPPAERLYAVEPEGVEISSPSPRTVVTCEYRTDLPTDFSIYYDREWRASCGGAGVSDGANASAHVVVVDNRVQLTHTRILATDHALVECVPCTWRRRWNAAHARRGNVAVWGARMAGEVGGVVCPWAGGGQVGVHSLPAAWEVRPGPSKGAVGFSRYDGGD